MPGGKLKKFWIPNAMNGGNFLANLAGWLTVEVLVAVQVPVKLREAARLLYLFNLIYPVLGFLASMVALYWFERPIRACLAQLLEGREPPPENWEVGRRRLLNEPYFAVGVDCVLWLLPAGFVYLAAPAAGLSPGPAALRPLLAGLLAMILAFFWLEHIILHRLAEVMFPQGDLSATRGTVRLRIWHRLAALVLAASILPLMTIHVTIMQSVRQLNLSHTTPEVILARLQTAVAAETVWFLLLALGLAILVGINLSLPLARIVEAVRRVARGDFAARVRVTSPDEIGYVGEVLNQMNEGLEEREFIRETFGRYVSSEVRDEILAGRVSLEGELVEVTMLFADLRDFTPLAESLSPHQVVRVLNGYFEEMGQAIEAAGGLVLQFIGDEVVAVFGAPLPLADHPTRAVAAALAMRGRLAAYNQRLAREGQAPLAHGVGIHTGQALAGNLGSQARQCYTLVGDTVNLASRLQGLTREREVDILLSGATQARLAGDIPLTALAPARVRGRQGTVELFTPPPPAA
ncbi:MAG: HAMP domain-containing protein [Deltaproteobacteria bacterium]|nr:HAMP domain-containing protein [Deltaproteobacteria bacterium]